MAQGYMQLVIAVDGWTESNRPNRICEGFSLRLYRPRFEASNPSRYRLLTGATRTDRRGGGCEKPLPQSAGVLSPGPKPQLQCRHYQLYRLLLMALQLAPIQTLYK